MTKLSTVRTLTILARVVGQSAGRNRTVSAVFKGARTTAAHFGRVLHQLWLEVTGFVFLALAFIGGVAFFREYTRYQAGQTTTARLLVAIIFTVTFVWFGVTSFWRVWKKSSRT
ncbi:MAG TPA: hypothetical protein VK579_08255 [Terriglobales bacterium]|jgi:hypothetical protein|nr:hypothetical protein [Terriglobales bacterium]